MKTNIKLRTFLVGVIIVAAIAVVLSTRTANATGSKPTNEQTQKQYQDQDQSQSQETNVNVIVGGEGGGPLATAAGGSLTINEAERPDDITIRNTPNVYAPPSMPTSPCRIGGSGGASGAGFGISLGGSKMDWECNTRETADAFARMGLPAIGLMMLCRTEAVTKALGDGGAGFSTEDCEAYVRKMQQPATVTTERDVRQDIELNALRHKLEVLQHEIDRCDEKTERAFETCINK